MHACPDLIQLMSFSIVPCLVCSQISYRHYLPLSVTLFLSDLRPRPPNVMSSMGLLLCPIKLQ